MITVFPFSMLKLNSVLQMQVYAKPTNLRQCPNGDSEWPQKYKDSVVNTFIRRGISHSSTWASTHCELERITQFLINNGYTNKHKWDDKPATPRPLCTPNTKRGKIVSTTTTTTTTKNHLGKRDTGRGR